MLRQRNFALCVCVLVLGLVFLNVVPGRADTLQGSNPVMIYELSGQITGVTTMSIQEFLSTAESTNASLAIIQLSTTGGELGAVSQIMQLFATSPIPVLVYVPPAAQALSGGTYLLTASYIAAMGPAARIGSCQPIAGIVPVTDPNYVNSLVTLMTTHSHLHERNETTTSRFILENLNLGPAEAETWGSVELVANSIPELLTTLESYTLVQREQQSNDITYRIIPTADLASYNYTQVIQDFAGIASVTLSHYLPSFGLQMLAFLANPIISFLLLQIGIWGFIFALNAPGHMGEFISVACIVLALVGLGIIGISAAGIVLMLLGIGLIVIEAKTDIGFAGLAGISGIACFVLGGIFFLPPSQWLIPTEIMWVFQGISAGIALIFSAIFGFAVIKAAEARRLTSDFDHKKIPGTLGIAQTNLDPEGMVRAFGESWMATTEKGVIKAGESVEVVRLEGIRLIVKRAEPPDEFK